MTTSINNWTIGRRIIPHFGALLAIAVAFGLEAGGNRRVLDRCVARRLFQPGLAARGPSTGQRVCLLADRRQFVSSQSGTEVPEQIRRAAAGLWYRNETSAASAVPAMVAAR